jgi:hypothetical protein
VPLKTPNFFGRQAELEQLSKYLQDGSKGRKMIVLKGLGGFGKTQLALHYWTMEAEDYTSRIWIDATSIETALESFKEIAAKLGHLMPSPSSSPSSVAGAFKIITAKVNRWLSHPSNDKWLLVIDNVEDLDGEIHMQSLLPSCEHGSIIITTTQAETASIFESESLEVSGMETEAGAELLLHRFRMKTPSGESE